jgi:hypothetical protein
VNWSLPMYRLVRAILAIAPLGLTNLAAGDEPAVARVLDELHARAAAADFEGYFALYAEGAIFLGTDREEYWPLDAFKAYARPRFATGTAWTYHPTERFIHRQGDVAWFEERLQHARYGEARGTGVLVNTEGGWRVAQYNLTLPIPNDLFDQMATEISAFYATPH